MCCCAAFVIAWGRCQRNAYTHENKRKWHNQNSFTFVVVCWRPRKPKKKKKREIGATIMSCRVFYDFVCVFSLSRASNSEFSFQCPKYVLKDFFLILYFSWAILYSTAIEWVSFRRKNSSKSQTVCRRLLGIYNIYCRSPAWIVIPNWNLFSTIWRFDTTGIIDISELLVPNRLDEQENINCELQKVKKEISCTHYNSKVRR